MGKERLENGSNYKSKLVVLCDNKILMSDFNCQKLRYVTFYFSIIINQVPTHTTININMNFEIFILKLIKSVAVA